VVDVQLVKLLIVFVEVVAIEPLLVRLVVVVDNELLVVESTVKVLVVRSVIEELADEVVEVVMFDSTVCASAIVEFDDESFARA